MSVADSTDTVCLQPHLLTKVTLVRLLEQKCMSIKHLNIMSKEQLIDLFQRIALPLPQRKYRQNHRGSMLTKLRNEKEGGKRKSVDNCAISYGFGDKSPVQHLPNSGIGDRLKPPPDAVNFEKKKIRLSSNSSRSNELDHIQIKKRKSDVTNGFVGEVKPESNEACETSILLGSSGGKSNNSHKVILKRSLSASTKPLGAPEREPEKKKEKKLITWP